MVRFASALYYYLPPIMMLNRKVMIGFTEWHAEGRGNVGKYLDLAVVVFQGVGAPNCFGGERASRPVGLPVAVIS